MLFNGEFEWYSLTRTIQKASGGRQLSTFTQIPYIFLTCDPSRQCVTEAHCHVSDVYELLAVPQKSETSLFHLNNCWRSKGFQYFTKKPNIRKKNKTKQICVAELCFSLLSSSINHLMTPQVYLVTLWRGPTPRLRTTGLNYLTYAMHQY